MASRPSALKTFGIIIGTLAALPVALYFLWWIAVVIIMMFQRPQSRPLPQETDKNYVYRRPSLQDAFDSPEQDFYRAGDRVFFFEKGDGGFSLLKSYGLKDGSIVLWTKFPKTEFPTFAFPPEGESIYTYQHAQGLFLKTFPSPTEDPAVLGKKIAPPVPEACGSTRDFFVVSSGEGVLAGCLPRGDASDDAASTEISVFFLESGRSSWSDRSPAAPWKDGKLRGHAAFGDGIFLLGETKVHRFDPVRRELVPVADLKEVLKESTYQPLLRTAGGLLALAGGDKLFFWGDGSSSFEDVFVHPSSATVRFWYDAYDSDRAVVQGGRALIQIVQDASGRKGLGYFRKDETGAWNYRGLMEDVAMVQPVAFAGDSIYFGDKDGLARREIGLQTCRSDAASDVQGDFLGAWDWIWKMAKGGEIAGYVLSVAPELCGIEIAVPPSLGEKGERRSLRVSLSSPESPSNFERVRVGDQITASVVRWTARDAVIDRVFIDLRDGAAVPGQIPLKNLTLTLVLIALYLATGVVSIFWSLRRMSQTARVCLARIFETEEQALSADRLRAVGLAVLGLGLLGLTMHLQGRPVDAVGFLEAVSLQIGAFWVLFSILYYVAAANLLKILGPKKPKRPISPSKPPPPPPPAFSPAGR